MINPWVIAGWLAVVVLGLLLLVYIALATLIGVVTVRSRHQRHGPSKRPVRRDARLAQLDVSELLEGVQTHARR
jgi:hypothetical protein